MNIPLAPGRRRGPLRASPPQSPRAILSRCVCRPDSIRMHVRCCRRTYGVIEMSNDDAWMRDIGPNFVVNDRSGDVRGVDWIFRSWGGIYSPYDWDDQIARKVLDIEQLDRYRAPIVCEGGALQCDGEGTLITTRQCLLNPNRKVGNTDAQIEQALMDYLGVDKVIWLPRGCPFDTTDGHIDDLAVFARPGVVLLTWTEDRSDPARRSLARGVRDSLSRDRCTGPPIQHSESYSAERDPMDGGGGGRGRSGRWDRTAGGRGAHRGHLHQLLHRQQGRVRADL